jgi:hypothetical protein
MNREGLISHFAILVLISVAGSTTRAQTPGVSPTPERPAQTSGQATQAETPSAGGAQVNSKEDQVLAANSQKAIIETGISEPYFKEHFRLAKVVNEEGDRRVEWKYSINDYETMLVDDVGYYTSPAGERVDVHSIKSLLYSAYDIKRTITRRKADSALQSCLGKHSSAQVVYRALKAPGKARLYLTARSIESPEAEDEKDKEKGKESEREIEGISFIVGFVDLENGKCRIERGQVTP